MMSKIRILNKKIVVFSFLCMGMTHAASAMYRGGCDEAKEQGGAGKPIAVVEFTPERPEKSGGDAKDNVSRSF
jgi:hypothetical protein